MCRKIVLKCHPVVREGRWQWNMVLLLEESLTARLSLNIEKTRWPGKVLKVLLFNAMLTIDRNDIENSNNSVTVWYYMREIYNRNVLTLDCPYNLLRHVGNSKHNSKHSLKSSVKCFLAQMWLLCLYIVKSNSIVSTLRPVSETFLALLLHAWPCE